MTTVKATLTFRESGQLTIRFTPVEADFLHDGLPVAGILTIESCCDAGEYLVTEFPTSYHGRGFRIDKLGTDATASACGYTVFCGKRELDAQCECIRFLQFGHCHHVDAVKILMISRWL